MDPTAPAKGPKVTAHRRVGLWLGRARGSAMGDGQAERTPAPRRTDATKKGATVIHDFILVEAPFDLAKARVLTDPDWLTPIVCRGYAEGEDFCLKLGFGADRPKVGKRVRL